MIFKSLQRKIESQSWENRMFNLIYCILVDALREIHQRVKPIWHIFQKEWEIYRTGTWLSNIRGRTGHCLIHLRQQLLIWITFKILVVLITFPIFWRSSGMQVTCSYLCVNMCLTPVFPCYKNSINSCFCTIQFQQFIL